MPAALIPLLDAFARFMPEVRSPGARTGSHGDLTVQKALVIEGDAVSDATGILETSQLAPEFVGQEFRAIFITGNLVAPHAVLMEPDYDWSPMLRVLGNVVARSMALGGSASQIDGDLKVSGVLFGFYNHGSLVVGGATHAPVILAMDYKFDFRGAVTREYVLSDAGRLNIPADFERRRLNLVLVPEVLSDDNSVKDAEVIDYLKRGQSILRPRDEIGKRPRRQLSKKARERIAALRARKAGGEPIVRVDLKSCEMRFVPDELKEFAGASELVLSDNKVRRLPAWLGDFSNLELLMLESCGLKSIPAEIVNLPRLRELNILNNDLKSLPFSADAFRKLEVLYVGQKYNWDDDDIQLFTADLDLANFPWLRVLRQDFQSNGIAYGKTADLWNAPHLEVLSYETSFTNGIPEGLLKARNLEGLAFQCKKATLDSVCDLLPHLPKLSTLTIGYSDLSRDDLARLYEALPNVLVRFPHLEELDINYEHPLYQEVSRIERLADRRDWPAAALAIDAVTGRIDLRRPFLPTDILNRILLVKMRILSDRTEFETDAARRADFALLTQQWVDTVLATLPTNPDIFWRIDYSQFWNLRISYLQGRALAAALRPNPDAALAFNTLDVVKEELDRYLLPLNPHWHGQRIAEIAEIRRLAEQR